MLAKQKTGKHSSSIVACKSKYNKVTCLTELSDPRCSSNNTLAQTLQQRSAATEYHCCSCPCQEYLCKYIRYMYKDYQHGDFCKTRRF